MANIVSVGEQEQSSGSGIASFKQVGSLGVQKSFTTGDNTVIAAGTTLPITTFHALKIICRKVNTTISDVAISYGSSSSTYNFSFTASETNVTSSVVLFVLGARRYSGYISFSVLTGLNSAEPIEIKNNSLNRPIYCHITANAILQFTFLFYEMT